jgi:hypothetical protein
VDDVDYIDRGPKGECEFTDIARYFE